MAQQSATDRSFSVYRDRISPVLAALAFIVAVVFTATRVWDSQAHADDKRLTALESVQESQGRQLNTQAEKLAGIAERLERVTGRLESIGYTPARSLPPGTIE